MLVLQTDVLLGQLRSREPSDAWTTFLANYSPLLLDVVHLFERDADAAADCYLFVCEQLSRDNFKRLLRFRPNGPASFPTWLHVWKDSTGPCAVMPRRRSSAQSSAQSEASGSSVSMKGSTRTISEPA